MMLDTSHIRTFPDLVQGSDEWLAARCGLLTASEMKLILTPTLKIANNEKTRAHLYELLAQRINQHVEPSFITDDMLRGIDDEFYARDLYAAKFAPVSDMGFMTNDKWGFRLGYSPDALVGDDGAIEIKSRRQKFQAQTMIEHVTTGSSSIPDEYVLQIQTGLLVSERKWIDFISYCGGMPMIVIRVYPDPEIQRAILEAATMFESALKRKQAEYQLAFSLSPAARLVPTERREIVEIF